MLVNVDDLQQIGALIRAVRKADAIRQDDLAAMLDLSHVYLRSLERGQGTAHAGGLLKVLQELGIRVQLDVPLSQDAVNRVLSRTENASKT